jgi:hypothetical protein
MAKPSADDLKRLIRSPKPAFTAAGVTNDPNREPSFSVIYNGQGSWMTERPTQTELLSGKRTVLQTANAVELIDMPVSVNNDVKAALDGKRLAYLDEGVLELVGSLTVAGRPCFQVRAWGLKQGEDGPSELAVDTETGVILRMQGGNGGLFEITEFRFGASLTD